MRKLIATEFVTLDSIFEDPGGAEKTEHGGWSFNFWNEEAALFKHDELFRSDSLLLGKVTYEGFAKAWPTMEGTGDFGERMNAMKKYVVSSTLSDPTWNNTSIFPKYDTTLIKELKTHDGQDILLQGSATLLASLLHDGLIDEMTLLVHPVVLGSGRRLFQDTVQTFSLTLLESRALKTGLVILRYRVNR